MALIFTCAVYFWIIIHIFAIFAIFTFLDFIVFFAVFTIFTITIIIIVINIHIFVSSSTQCYIFEIRYIIYMFIYISIRYILFYHFIYNIWFCSIFTYFKC